MNSNDSPEIQSRDFAQRPDPQNGTRGKDFEAESHAPLTRRSRSTCSGLEIRGDTGVERRPAVDPIKVVEAEEELIVIVAIGISRFHYTPLVLHHIAFIKGLTYHSDSKSPTAQSSGPP
jgi:hypothetical protein